MSPDDVFVKPSPDWIQRLIVIDGCNVGRSSCSHLRETVSCAGLLSVIRWLLLRDFECVIFLPVIYNNPSNNSISQVHLLSKLEEMGLVTFTPARGSNGDRRAFINYDDLYLTTMAEKHGGVVLSGDRFRDILAQSKYSEFHGVITDRVVDIQFLFLTHDVVHFGDDIFYRAAPELFLQEDLSTRASSIAMKIHCSPSHSTFSRVLRRRQLFTKSRRKQFLNICDELIYELCEREGIRPMRMTTLPTFQSIEEDMTNLDMLQLDEDEKVWQQGDVVMMERNTVEHVDLFFPELLTICNTLDPFHTSNDISIKSTSIDLSEPSSASPSNPQFDFVQQQIEMSRVSPPLDLDDIQPVLEEEPTPREDPKQKLQVQLMAVFPRDVVETVLAMNASEDINFLAEQCILQMNQ